MSDSFLIDPAEFENRKPEFPEEIVRKFVPHRFEFALLDGVYQIDPEKKTGVGFYRASDDSFWVRGHVPGRPLMPGVLMAEAAAQLCTFIYKQHLSPGNEIFMGFGGLDEVRFRGEVRPGTTLIMAARWDRVRPKASYWTAQSFANGKLVFEGKIFAISLS